MRSSCLLVSVALFLLSECILGLSLRKDLEESLTIERPGSLTEKDEAELQETPALLEALDASPNCEEWYGSGKKSGWLTRAWKATKSAVKQMFTTERLCWCKQRWVDKKEDGMRLNTDAQGWIPWSDVPFRVKNVQYRRCSNHFVFTKDEFASHGGKCTSVPVQPGHSTFKDLRRMAGATRAIEKEGKLDCTPWKTEYPEKVGKK
uniref:C-type lectin domain-containing protein n=1 Tax=Chromera velia CCMP2878 TaxID=1169474 RepID=A0A0G4I2J3_9ALVE|eukprot:Cvel_10345.t1-p1 / transcript=Cvel_10345.t1 / gene=Cvel_10345 / organism=Chromera_velia_CCMP2878 / gene_product=hypothetical protein / transcript_product=hypothetical protein / location=Cvel_scaffold621:75256-75986(+) / protein_length=204 / sequence_SO=supercontig / SO=protein_coding / is_pseudo=false